MYRWKKQVEADQVFTKNANQKLAEWRRKEHIGTSNADLNAITVDEAHDQPEFPTGNASEIVNAETVQVLDRWTFLMSMLKQFKCLRKRRN